MEKDKKAVLLLNLGSPQSMSDVKRFLYELFSDSEIIKIPFSRVLQKPFAFFISRVRANKTIENYKKIGGISPLAKITEKQAELLEKKLNEHGYRALVLPAMKYSNPRIKHCLEKVIKVGESNKNKIAEIIALPLYPQYSSSTTQAAFNEIERYLEEKNMKDKIKVRYVKWWYDNEKYINALANRIIDELGKIEEKKVALLFSAHSLPEKAIKEGDPYKKQVEETAKKVVKIVSSFKKIDYFISYQSEIKFMKWLEPRTSDVIKEIAAKGYERLLVIPVSFVSDNLETLYEIDIFYRELAESLGLKFSRVPCFNYSADFIDVLFDVIADYF